MRSLLLALPASALLALVGCASTPQGASSTPRMQQQAQQPGGAQHAEGCACGHHHGEEGSTEGGEHAACSCPHCGGQKGEATAQAEAPACGCQHEHGEEHSH